MSQQESNANVNTENNATIPEEQPISFSDWERAQFSAKKPDENAPGSGGEKANESQAGAEDSGNHNPGYDEVIAENAKLKAKYNQLDSAMKEALQYSHIIEAMKNDPGAIDVLIQRFESNGVDIEKPDVSNDKNGTNVDPGYARYMAERERLEKLAKDNQVKLGVFVKEMMETNMMDDAEANDFVKFVTGNDTEITFNDLLHAYRGRKKTQDGANTTGKKAEESGSNMPPPSSAQVGGESGKPGEINSIVPTDADRNKDFPDPNMI